MILESLNTASLGVYDEDLSKMQTSRDKENIRQITKQNLVTTTNMQPNFITDVKAEYKKTLVRRSKNQFVHKNDPIILATANGAIEEPLRNQALAQPLAQAKICENKPNSSLHSLPIKLKSSLLACSHQRIVSYRCKYCKDCGVFLPKNEVLSFRESRYNKKLNLNPDRVLSLMLKSQKKNRCYDLNSKFLKERKTLVKWICELGRFMNYCSDTVHIAASYLDFVLLQFEMPQNKLRLLALVCIYLAGKFNENDSKAMRMKDIYELTKGLYSLELLEKTELLVLEILQWNIRTVTPLQFLEFFLERGVVFSTDDLAKLNVGEHLLSYIRKGAKFIINVTLQLYSFNRFDSHIVACASIAALRKFAGLSLYWNEQLAELTTASWQQIELCFSELIQICQKSCPKITRNFPKRSSAFTNELENSSKICLKINDMLIEEEKIPRFDSEKMLIEDESSVLIKSKENPSNFVNSLGFGQNIIYQPNPSGSDMLIESLSQKEANYSINDFSICEKPCQDLPIHNFGFSAGNYFQLLRTPDEVENYVQDKILSQINVGAVLPSAYW